MRVVQLAPIAPPHGGVQANAAAIAERLRHFKHESKLVAIVRSDGTNADAETFLPQNARELLHLLFNLKADIVHLHIGGDFALRLAALAFLCGVLPRKKSILTFHSGAFASSALGKTAKPFSLRGFAVRRLDKIIVVNREMRDLFERYGVAPEKIELVAPHVLREPDENVEIPQRLKTFVETHEPLLFSASGLEPIYDVALQIRVLNLLKTEFPRIGLLVAGSGDQKQELQNLIDSTNCNQNVLLAGDVAHEIVLHLAKRASVALRTTHFDGDAISVREAIFLGTPVVASDNEMRPENVILFKIGDAEDLRRAILIALKQNKTIAPKIVDGWKNIDKVLQIYRELLQTK